MKYLKHYWISLQSGQYAYQENPVEKRHPEQEFPGLDVRIWMHDQNDIDVCLSRVPDSLDVQDVYESPNRTVKVVQVITEEEFNSVQIPIEESQRLMLQSITESDETLRSQLKEESELKYEEAKTALHSL